MNKHGISVLLIALLALAQLIVSCGDTSTDGNVRDNWEINVLIARNGDSPNGFVNVYAEIFKNDQAYVPGILTVDGRTVQSLGNGTYQGSFSPALLEDTSEISMTTPVDQFQFKQLIVVPDTFSFDFDQLPNNQVFSSTNVVNVRWNGSDFEGMQGSYFVVIEPANAANPAIGAFELFNGTIGSIPREAFRNSQGQFQTGSYNVWVVSRVDQPIQSPNLPFTIPSGIFSPNIDRVGVTGQIGAIYISPRKTITAVAGS